MIMREALKPFKDRLSGHNPYVLEPEPDTEVAEPEPETQPAEAPPPPPPGAPVTTEAPATDTNAS